MIPWIRPTFRVHVAFLTAVPTNNVVAWIRVLVLMLTLFLLPFAITFPFLASLAFLASFAKAVHLHRICGALCRNCLECELTSAGFNVGLDFTSNLRVRDQSCAVHGKMLFQLTRNNGFKCGCIDVLIKSCCRRSTRFAPLVSANLFFTFQVLREDLVACIDLEPRFVAQELCASLH